MPNRSTHVKTGALVGVAISALGNATKQLSNQELDPNQKFDWWELLRYSIKGGAVGAVCGALPDILEPATNPHHRKFFHSIIVGGVVTAGTYKVANSEELNEDEKSLLLSASFSYLSHLALDSSTPMGLPLI